MTVGSENSGIKGRYLVLASPGDVSPLRPEIHRIMSKHCEPHSIDVFVFEEVRFKQNIQAQSQLVRPDNDPNYAGWFAFLRNASGRKS